MYLSVDRLRRGGFCGVMDRDCSGQRCFIEITIGDALHGTNTSQSSSLGFSIVDGHCLQHFCLQHFCLQQWMRSNLLKWNARILAGGSLGILPCIYIGVGSRLFLSIFHTHRNMGGENGKMWAKGIPGLVSDAPWALFNPFSPLSSLSRAVRVF